MIGFQKNADVVFVNGKIYTVDKKLKWAEAIAVKDKINVFVGSNEEAKAYIQEGTEVVDLDGKLMLPGLFDTHIHPMLYVHDVCGINLSKCETVKEYQTAIRNYQENNPKRETIIGFGWLHTTFDGEGPKKEMLDEVVGDKPVLMYSGDLHNLWVNSKALKIAKINKDTTVTNGEIIKDKDGNPTGWLNDLGAMAIVEKHIKGYDKDDFAITIKEFQKKANQVGITTIHDAGLLQKPEVKYEAYRKLDKNNELTLRTRLSAMINPEENNVKDDISFAVHMRKDNQYNSERLQTNTVKFFIDGVPEADTALLEKPYEGTENYGMQLWQVGRLNELFAELDKQQFQIHVHAMGDRATRYTLDALENAEKKNGKRDARHLIAHLTFVNEEDFNRFKELDVIPVVQPAWFEKTELYHEILTYNLGERANKQYPMKTFFDHDITVAYGCDGPVTITESSLEISFSPLVAIQQGITRCNFDQDHNNSENVLYPKERVTLEQMIEAVTINSAHACFLEDVTGTIETGKYADLVVLEKNIFEIPVEEIARIEVFMTVLEGEIVYTKQN